MVYDELKFILIINIIKIKNCKKIDLKLEFKIKK